MEPSKSCSYPIPEPPHMRAVGIFLRIMRRHHACVERRLIDRNIHHSQHRLLVQLTRQQEGPPSQKELAEIMGVSPAAVTTTLQRLEKEEYVTRSATDGDNRRNEIRVTEKGYAKILESREIFEAADREMFEGFTAEEMATLISFMERIDRNLDAAGAPTDPRCRNHPNRKEE